MRLSRIADAGASDRIPSSIAGRSWPARRCVDESHPNHSIQERDAKSYRAGRGVPLGKKHHGAE
jgi:hypothetical protein